MRSALLQPTLNVRFVGALLISILLHAIALTMYLRSPSAITKLGERIPLWAPIVVTVQPAPSPATKLESKAHRVPAARSTVIETAMAVLPKASELVQEETVTQPSSRPGVAKGGAARLIERALAAARTEALKGTSQHADDEVPETVPRSLFATSSEALELDGSATAYRHVDGRLRVQVKHRLFGLLCYEILEADPLDPLSPFAWRLTRC